VLFAVLIVDNRRRASDEPGDTIEETDTTAPEMSA